MGTSKILSPRSLVELYRGNISEESRETIYLAKKIEEQRYKWEQKQTKKKPESTNDMLLR
jgi:hypothetical protein